MSITDRLRDMAIMAEEWQHPIIDDAIAALEAFAKPQPIETAPKDGRKFLAFTCDYQFGSRFNTRWQEGRWDGRTPDDAVGSFQSDNGQIITHWLPLPPDPE
jgi:hypothetical protein